MSVELSELIAMVFYAPYLLIKEAQGEVDTGAKEMLKYMAVFLALGAVF